MMISGINTAMQYLGQVSSMRNRAAPAATDQTTIQKKPDFAKMFTQLDSDGNGSLGGTEIQNLTERISEATGVSTDLSQFLATYDADGSGALSKDETTAALEANRPQGPPPGGMMGGMGSAQGSSGPDFAKMFSEMDADSSGGLSASETKTLADMISHATGTTTKAADLMKTYDANGDGVLSQDETTAALEANRPQGPPPQESTSSGAGNSDSLSMAMIEKYLQMAALGNTQGQSSSDIFSLLNDASSSVSRIA